MKYFRFPVEHVLWEMSYANLNMYLATIPSYDSEETKKKGEQVKEVEGIDELAGLLGI